ncbi:MAG: cobalamin biosynthesis protein CbiG, partial [Oscillospiraceae bacterium]|nr:cobalamin biosynthesis protein CbiG [Oscillospiraceae bacterium]
MKTAVFAYTRRGCGTALQLRDALGGEVRLFTVERLLMEGFEPIPRPSRPFYGELFCRCDALVFVGACGIAVREIAPFVRDKRTDPAVVSVDERARFVVPLLSGHIGGANELAVKLAESLGAVPVVTTATDTEGRFSVDAWAKKQGFVIADMKAAKAVSAAILERDIPLCCDLPVKTPLPAGVFAGDAGDIGIYIGWEIKEPFQTTLRLIPPAVHLGIGCRKGTEAGAIERAVSAARAAS